MGWLAYRLSPKSPLDSVEPVAQYVAGKTIRFEDRDHAPGQGIRAIVGRSAGDIVCAGPMRPRVDSKRFLIARSLYHAMVTAQSSHRLVTDAFSWEQKASRAFAAELLAPRWALAQRISTSDADFDAVESLSREFKASTMVIENQLENAGISLVSE
ncbi:MAG: ImmA/IrrE family metallo-endopeptidase [Thermoguttaceae bacterium]